MWTNANDALVTTTGCAVLGIGYARGYYWSVLRLSFLRGPRGDTAVQYRTLREHGRAAPLRRAAAFAMLARGMVIRIDTCTALHLLARSATSHQRHLWLDHGWYLMSTTVLVLR